MYCSIFNISILVPYAWDETTLTEKLCVQLKNGSESRQFDLGAFGSQGKVYYESYFYIVATETNDQSENQKSLVLDVPQGKAVILTRKVSLWTNGLDNGYNRSNGNEDNPFLMINNHYLESWKKDSTLANDIRGKFSTCCLFLSFN